MKRIRILLSHPAIILMMCAFCLGLGIVIFNGPWWTVAFALLGVPAQMLNEYNLHRYIFHLPPPKNQTAFNLLYRAHYGHHDFPTNIGLFFVPIWVAVPMLILNFSIVWLVVSLIAPIHALSITASIVLVGGVGTFLSYEWFHMTAHLTIPKVWLERHVTTLHNQHHFRDFSKWFHVSPGGQIVDRIMGTAIDRETLKNQQRIEFIRTLGLRPDDHRLVAARERYAKMYQITDEEIQRAARG